MKLSDSPDYFNAIANHPKVFPAVSCKGMDRIDFAPVWDRLMGLECEGGGWVLDPYGAGLFEVHTLFLPKTRGIREKAAEACRFMFCGTSAMELATKVPVDLPHALALARAMGFRVVERQADGWERDSGPVDVDHLHLSLDDWRRHAGLSFGEVRDTCHAFGMPEKGDWLMGRWTRLYSLKD